MHLFSLSASGCLIIGAKKWISPKVGSNVLLAVNIFFVFSGHPCQIASSQLAKEPATQVHKLQDHRGTAL